MKQKEKELLLKDLSARLAYNTIVQIKNSGVWNLKGIEQDNIDEIGYEVIVWHGKNYPSSKTSFPISICKPYLFPLSSMIEEQKEEFRNKFDINIDISKIFDGIDFCGSISFRTISEIIDWLNENHFDYQSLIEKGLAINATGLNIY